jgi:hypothetical protein
VNSTRKITTCWGLWFVRESSFSADEVNSNELVVDNLEANNQLLLFKISLTNGDLILEKTVF